VRLPHPDSRAAVHRYTGYTGSAQTANCDHNHLTLPTSSGSFPAWDSRCEGEVHIGGTWGRVPAVVAVYIPGIQRYHFGFRHSCCSWRRSSGHCSGGRDSPLFESGGIEPLCSGFDLKESLRNHKHLPKPEHCCPQTWPMPGFRSVPTMSSGRKKAE
jgi:hypothetical protein